MQKLSRSQKYAGLYGQLTNDNEANIGSQDLSSFRNRLDNIQETLAPNQNESAYAPKTEYAFRPMNSNRYQQDNYNNAYNAYNNVQQPQQPQPQQTYNNPANNNPFAYQPVNEPKVEPVVSQPTNNNPFAYQARNEQINFNTQSFNLNQQASQPTNNNPFAYQGKPQVETPVGQTTYNNPFTYQPVNEPKVEPVVSQPTNNNPFAYQARNEQTNFNTQSFNLNQQASQPTNNNPFAYQGKPQVETPVGQTTYNNPFTYQPVNEPKVEPVVSQPTNNNPFAYQARNEQTNFNTQSFNLNQQASQPTNNNPFAYQGNHQVETPVGQASYNNPFVGSQNNAKVEPRVEDTSRQATNNNSFAYNPNLDNNQNSFGFNFDNTFTSSIDQMLNNTTFEVPKNNSLDDFYSDVFKGMSDDFSQAINPRNDSYMNQTIKDVNNHNQINGQTTLNQIVDNTVDELRRDVNQASSGTGFNGIPNNYTDDLSALNIQPNGFAVENTNTTNLQTMASTLQATQEMVDLVSKEPEDVVEIKNISETAQLSKEAVSETIPFVVTTEEDEEIEEEEEEGSNTILNIILIILIIVLVAVLGLIVFYILKTKGII